MSGPLPAGTVTFLRTDVEGSMRLARAHGRAWDEANAAHLAILRVVVDQHDGTVVRTEGDALFAAFPTASAGVAAAVHGLTRLSAHPWPEGLTVPVRMGLHSGEAVLSGADYGGFEVNRAARVAAVAHGGQVVLSGPTQQLTADSLPEGVTTMPLGDYVLSGVPHPERLYQLVIPGMPRDFPPVRAGRAVQGNLEPRSTTFVGRETDLAELRELLAHARLLTLTGPGGIGKSSLATELARSVAEDFPDGAWFVPLAVTMDPDEVPSVVARTLGLFDGPHASAAETLPDFVAGRSLILVLDNFEQVLDAAGLVTRLLNRSPRSRIVVTSRAPLHLTGEQEYPVRPLGAAAVTLFEQRARAVLPHWTSENADSLVEQICELVDGLPLGVELAAARVPLLPLPALRDRLAARLGLPGPARRDAPARQRTLYDAVAWSHDLLPEQLRRSFHRLSVFEGGFGVPQAAAVMGVGVGPALHELAELADQSLLVRDVTGGEPRFAMLETVRVFALARLAEDGDEAEARLRHATAYLELGREFAGREGTREEGGWIRRVAPDEANIREAVRWSIDSGEAVLAWRLVAAYWRFWQASGHLAEGRPLAEQAIALPDAPQRHPDLVWALGAAGSLAYWQQGHAAALQHYRAQVDLARALDHPAGLADGLLSLSFYGLDDLQSVELSDALDEAIAVFGRLGDERGLARCEWVDVNRLIESDNASDTEVQERCNRLLERFHEVGDTRYHAMTAGTLTWWSFRHGRRTDALRWFGESLLESFEQGDVATATIALQVGVMIALQADRPDAAARLAGAYDALTLRYAVRPPAALQLFVDEQDPFEETRTALAPDVYEQEYDIGSRLSLPEAIELLVGLTPSR